jgi:RecB family exonuclease
MGIGVEWVPCGRDAADALRRRIAAVKGDEPLTPVTVIVPSNHVSVATRRLLASGVLGPACGNGVGLAAVSFMTPYRLAELLGAPPLAGSGRRPVSTPVIAAALRAALADDPGLFAPVASHPATETALVEAYRELREVSSAHLDALAGTGPRARDVVRLHRAARARLEPDWYDEQDLMAAAARALDAKTATALGTPIVFLPQRLSPHACLLLGALARARDVTVIAGTTGDPDADAEVAAGLDRIAATANTSSPPFTPTRFANAAHTRITLVSDADEEVRVAVRAVVGAVRTGTPLDRVAILYPDAEPYARLVHEQLSAAGIAANGPAVVPLAGRVAGRVLLELLALPERDFRRQDVFAWLASAPVLVHGRWAPTVAWERLSREAGVVAGRRQWDQRLATLEHQLDKRAADEEANEDEQEWKAQRHRDDAERVRELRTFALALIDDLAGAAASSRSWGEHADWARRHLNDALGGMGRRETWPRAERTAADRLDAALDRMAALEGVEGPVGLDVFARTLELELESDLGRVGRFGDGVFVGPVSMGVGLDLDLVVVLGLVEGTFPSRVREDSLLTDDERAVADGELALRAAHVDRQRRQLLGALAGATRQLLCVPRGDLRRSSERVPSRWALEIASTLAGHTCWPDDLAAADAPWVEHEASFEAGLRHLAFPATHQEHHLRALLGVAPKDADGLAAVAIDPATIAGATVLGARRSAHFTRFDGNLAGLAVDSPVARVTSATQMQRWAGCPFSYLLRDVLFVQPVENPEDRLQITPWDWGTLVHTVLERFIAEVLARAPADQPDPDEPWSPADRARLAAIGEEVFAEFEARGLTGRPIFWKRDRSRILADLQRFLVADDVTRHQRGTRPIAAELAFGRRETEADAVALDLPDGRELRFRGQADRVDVADDGSLHVVDYKTGTTNGYRDLSETDPDLRGLKLQLAVYGAAARAHRQDPDARVVAEYWFVSYKGKFERIGYEVTDKVLDRVGDTLGTIVGGIEHGVFAAHPTATSTSLWVECDACDPDALGVTELRRAWDRKRVDPALAPYAHLAEPLEDAVIEIVGEELPDD